MAVLAFDRRKVDLLNLHRDIDKLIALTTTLCCDAWHPAMRKSVADARVILEQIQARCEAAKLLPEEESVIDVKITRARSRLSFLGENYEAQTSSIQAESAVRVVKNAPGPGSIGRR